MRTSAISNNENRSFGVPKAGAVGAALGCAATYAFPLTTKEYKNYFTDAVKSNINGKAIKARRAEIAAITESLKGENIKPLVKDIFEKSIEVLEKKYPGKGQEYAIKLKDTTIALYKKCADYALSKGIIIADTKFEFGLDENGEILLADEVLTPDSSRFWPLEGYKAGQGQPSFDKQFVRDWLKANPDNDLLLPDEVVDKTIAKYKEAYELLTGKPFSRS